MCTLVLLLQRLPTRASDAKMLGTCSLHIIARALSEMHDRKEGAALHAQLALHVYAEPVGCKASSSMAGHAEACAQREVHAAHEHANGIRQSWASLCRRAEHILGQDVVSALMRLHLLVCFVQPARRACLRACSTNTGSAHGSMLAALLLDSGDGRTLHQQTHSHAHSSALSLILAGPGLAEQLDVRYDKPRERRGQSAPRTLRAEASRLLSAHTKALGLFPIGGGSMSAEQLQDYVAALVDAAEQLRIALQHFHMRRLVNQNMAAIKARLWRPWGPLVQRRLAQHATKRSRESDGGEC